MSRPAGRRAVRLRGILLDCLILLILSLGAEAAALSFRLGRGTVCTDSYQYVAATEALLTPGQTPHFEMRKPGYPLFLAGIKLAFGQLGWVAIVCNHALLVFLPLAAYGLGVHLHSRLLGWGAAVLVMARLQTALLGHWMLSEALYGFLLSFGLLAFVVGLRRPRAGIWLGAAGMVLGLAWLTRGTAVAVIPVALLAVAVVHRHEWRRAAKLCAAFALPIGIVIIFECSLNYTFARSFRPSTGTAGMCLLTHRLGAFQGAELPRTNEANRLLALLPERKPQEVFVSNYRDQWVARYRAVHDESWDDWEFDDRCRRTAMAMIRSDAGPFLEWSARLTLRHLFRQGRSLAVAPVPESGRRGSLIHPRARNPEEGKANWYEYWSLPHLPLEESIQLVRQVKAAAERGPFGRSESWSALRYWKTKPSVARTLDALTWAGSLWPGFALLLCGVLRLNRTTCVVLGIMYLVEAIFLGVVTVTDERYQSVWLAVDTTLAAALTMAGLARIAQQLRRRLLRVAAARAGIQVQTEKPLVERQPEVA